MSLTRIEKIPRLKVTSENRAFHLFLQFNYSANEKKVNEDAYEVAFWLLMVGLKNIFREKGIKEHEDAGYYVVNSTNNFDGNCLGVQWAYVNDLSEALNIVRKAMDFALNFKSERGSATDEEMETINECVKQAQAIIRILEEDIFTYNSVEFEITNTDPFA